MTRIALTTLLRLVSDPAAYWPLLLSFAWPAALIFVWSLGVPFLSAPLVLMFWTASAVASLMLALLWAAGRAWLRATATLVLPLTALAAYLHAGLVWDMAAWAGESIHLGVMRPFYLWEIAQKPGNEPKLAAWDWDGFAGILHGAAYDESDEILSSHPSEAWKKRASRTWLGCGVIGVTPAGGHFYVVSLAC